MNREARRATLLRLFRGVPYKEWHSLNAELFAFTQEAFPSTRGRSQTSLDFYLWVTDKEHGEYLAERFRATRDVLVRLYGPEGGEDLDWILALAKIEEAQ